MRHQTQEQRQKWQQMLTIATIVGLLNEGKTKQAIGVAEQNGITSKQFGIISSYVESTTAGNISYMAKKIYNHLKTAEI